MENPRPDPDALLATLDEKQGSGHRGRLKIFFGAAPGVGKTCAMLDAAQRELRAGVDVVIGYLEPHQRPETTARAAAFERIPTRTVEHRGVSVLEFDLEKALARKPKLILVDELAHTNAPGSTNSKRWQDIDQLLESGIDVSSTLNVQHLESINDHVARITGIQVRERVPDSIFEMAWEVELVDIAPDDLLERMREGKIYLEEQAERAQDAFFKKANLVALREIALRRMADRVNAQLENYRRAQPLPTTWPLGDRLLVCVGPSPHSAKIIRAAKRMASSLQCPWIAAHVDSAGAEQLSSASRERLLANLRLAERLGAVTAFLSASDTVEEVVLYARKHNISKIIVGKPTQPRWREWFRGSFVYELTRRCGEIDVYVISGDPGTDEQRPRSLRFGSPLIGEYAQAAAAVGIATGMNALLDGRAAPVNMVMIYLLSVVLTSLRCSKGPSFLASFLSVAVFDFVFVPPRWTFAVEDTEYLFTFSVMLLTGLIISSLTSRVRDQARFARDRESRTFALYTLSREFAVARTEVEIAEACVRNLRHALDAQAVMLFDRDDIDPTSEPIGTFVPNERGRAVARWVKNYHRPAGVGTDTLPTADATYYPVIAHALTRAIVGVRFLDAQEASDPERQQLIDAVLGQVSAALQRIDLSSEAERTRVDIAGERLRNALLSAVSHDLRTPLAAIEGAGSTLLTDTAKLDPVTREDLLRTIVDEAEHLNRLIANLLDATRLDAGVLEPRREWESLEEIVSATLRRLVHVLAGHPLKMIMPANLPLVRVDAVLMQQAIQNILENGAKYSPAGSPLSIITALAGDRLVLEILDSGPGIPAEELPKIFEKFYRSPAHQAGGRSGVGLGLPVAAGIVHLHQGTIVAENLPEGGAVFRITLPVEHDAQAVVDEAIGQEAFTEARLAHQDREDAAAALDSPPITPKSRS